jgi:hypothetical protein
MLPPARRKIEVKLQEMVRVAEFDGHRAEVEF